MPRESRRDRRVVGVDRDDVDQAVLHGALDPTRVVVPLLDTGRHDFSVDGLRDDPRLVQRLDGVEPLRLREVDQRRRVEDPAHSSSRSASR